MDLQDLYIADVVLYVNTQNDIVLNNKETKNGRNIIQ